MAEDLGSAVLELHADAGPMKAEMASAHLAMKGGLSKSGVAAAVATGAAFLAVGAAVGVGLYQVAENFDQAYDTIEARTGATGEEMESLKKDFREVFKDVPADAQTVGTAIGELNGRLGLTGKELQERAKQFLNLSNITGTDVKTNIEAVSKAFRDWEVPTSKQADTLDGLFRVSQETGIGVDDLAGKIQQFGSPLRQLGFTIEESASMFGIFEAAGVNVQTLMPGFKMAISNVLKPTDDLRASMKRLGIDLKDGPEAAVKQFITALANSKDPLSMTSTAMDLFGKRAGSDMVEAISQGRLNLDDMVETFKNGSTTINGTADDTADLSEKMQILKNRGMLALEAPAMTLFDGLTKLADAVIWLTDAWSGLSPGLREAIRVTTGFVAVAGGLAFTIYKVDKAMKALNITMKLNPYVAIAAATIAIGVLIYTHWDQIKEFLARTWEQIKQTAAKVWNGIEQFFRRHWKTMLMVFTGPVGIITGLVIRNWDRIKEATDRIWTTIKNTLVRVMNSIANKIKTGFTDMKDAVVTALNRTVTFVGNIPDRMVKAIRSVVGGMVGIAQDAFGGFKNRATTIAENIIEFVGKLPKRIINAVGDLSQTLYDAGKALIKGLLNGIKDGLDAVWDEVGKIAGKIKDLKGPLPKDLKLLVPEGGAIIEGLGHGMHAEFENLQSDIAGFGPSIAAQVNLSGASAPAGSPMSPAAPKVVLEFASGMEWLGQFVTQKIDESGRANQQTYIAGAGRI